MPRYLTSLAKINIFRRRKVNFLTQAHLSHLWQTIFILVFVTNYPIRNRIIDGYYIWLSSDWTIWYNVTSLEDILPNICLVFYIYAITCRMPCQTIRKNHWEVECCTVILILSPNKTISTWTSCIIIQIVTQVE